jgi:hypothetical protein
LGGAATAENFFANKFRGNILFSDSHSNVPATDEPEPERGRSRRRRSNFNNSNHTANSTPTPTPTRLRRDQTLMSRLRDQVFNGIHTSQNSETLAH